MDENRSRKYECEELQREKENLIGKVQNLERDIFNLHAKIGK